jgi:hypothetical protein
VADLFISYAREDRPRVEKMARLLAKAGWSTFWDPQIKTGSSFDRVIEQALVDAKAVIVVWSQDSVKSDWVRAEAADALESNKLVPIRLDNVLTPVRYRQIHAADLSTWQGNPDAIEWQKLLTDLSSLIGEPPASAADRQKQKAPAAAEHTAPKALAPEPASDWSNRPPTPGQPIGEDATPIPTPRQSGIGAVGYVLLGWLLFSALVLLAWFEA